MAEIVYVLGAGFNCSVLEPNKTKQPPLARNFFQVFLRSSFVRFTDYYSTLFEEIERHWGLNRVALVDTPFDIEQCLTFFESQLADHLTPASKTVMLEARKQLLNVLMMYLGRFEFSDTTDMARIFGYQVMGDGADILTFNYDTVAEQIIESASGMTGRFSDRPVRAEDFDISHFRWNRNLAYGVKFSEVALPIAGAPQDIGGDQYYRHPSNSLYADTRVLKLHGSLNWLRHAAQLKGALSYQEPEIVLDRSSSVWPDAGPARDGGPWEPVIIPPQFDKAYQQTPIPEIWQIATSTLAECQKLVLIGYSFPSTDVQVRQLFLEAFSGHRLRELVVVNPDESITDTVRSLTQHDGPVTTCRSLQLLYGAS